MHLSLWYILPQFCFTCTWKQPRSKGPEEAGDTAKHVDPSTEPTCNLLKSWMKLVDVLTSGYASYEKIVFELFVMKDIVLIVVR